MATTYMVLTLPTVGGSTDAWGGLLNTALSAIDAHDHTTGKGTPVPSAGLLINADLEFNANDATEVRTVRMDSGVVTLVAGDIRCLYHVGGELYWRDAAGTATRITLNGAIDASSIGGITGMGATTAAVTYSSGIQYFAFTSNTNVPANIDAGFVFVRGPVSGGKGVRLGVDAAIAADWNFTFPTAAPTTTSVLTMDSSGNLLHNTPGLQVGFGQTVKTGEQATTATIPQDDTIPQITEGDQLSTLAYTPKKIGNLLLVEAVVQASATGAADTSLVVSLYKDADADAKATGDIGLPGATTSDEAGQCTVRHTHTVVSLTAQTWQSRVGTRAGASATVNRGVTNDYGGNMNSTLRITEISQ